MKEPHAAGVTLYFSTFRLQADGSLFRGKSLVHLPPKELAALRLLVSQAGQVVSGAQLKKALWGDVHVTADSIPKCVSSLRSRLLPADLIQTVYKRGYRFTAEVTNKPIEPEIPLPRLAISPFSSEWGVPEYLGPAIAEETIARLTNARPAQVSVLARDSVFTLAQRSYTGHQLGEALQADLVLTGTVRALPGFFRLRAEMIRVEDGTQIWVEDLMVQQDRRAGLEDELMIRLHSRLGSEPANDPGQGAAHPSRKPGQQSSAVRLDTPAAQVEPPHQLENEPLALSAHADDSNTGRTQEAYEIFQRARFEWRTLERHRMQDGLHHLARATELDPSLVSAKIELAHLCVTQAFYGFMAPTVAADLVRRTAESVTDYAQRAAGLLPALGWVCFYAERNLPAASWAFEQSAHLIHDPWTTRVRAMFALSRHRIEEAADLLRAALSVDPYSPWLHNRLAWTLHLNHQRAESVRQIEAGISRFPEHEGTNLYGAIILAYNGQAERAMRLAHDLAQRLPSFDLATAVHAYTLACAGLNSDALAIMERLEWMSRERFVLKSFNPAVYLAMDKPDMALAELRAANDDRCPWFFQMLADPRLAALEGRPEFCEMKAILAHLEAGAAEKASAGS